MRTNKVEEVLGAIKCLSRAGGTFSFARIDCFPYRYWAAEWPDHTSQERAAVGEFATSLGTTVEAMAPVRAADEPPHVVSPPEREESSTGDAG